MRLCANMPVTHFEAEVVHVFVSGAVDGAFGGELEGVEERVTLDAEGAVQLQQGVADPTGPVVHQLQSENRKVQYARY